MRSDTPPPSRVYTLCPIITTIMRLLTVEGGGQAAQHTRRPCSLLFILRSLSPSPRPAFVGIRGNFACWQLFHSTRESRAPSAPRRNIITPIVFHGAPLCLITTHRFESFEKRCVIHCTLTTGHHRRISERFYPARVS